MHILSCSAENNHPIQVKDSDHMLTTSMQTLDWLKPEGWGLRFLKSPCYLTWQWEWIHNQNEFHDWNPHPKCYLLKLFPKCYQGVPVFWIRVALCSWLVVLQINTILSCTTTRCQNWNKQTQGVISVTQFWVNAYGKLLRNTLSSQRYQGELR